jgi:hypothetical protein
VGRLCIGIFSHKLGHVVLTLLSPCGAYVCYSVCHPTGCLFGVMYIRFSYDDMSTGCSMLMSSLCCSGWSRPDCLFGWYLYMWVCLYRIK